MTVKPSRDILLAVLIEQCARTILAASTCLRNGFDNGDPIQGVNSTNLAKECGSVITAISALPLDVGGM